MNHGRRFGTIVALFLVVIMAVLEPLHAKELTVLQAERTASELLELSAEFKKFSLQKLPKGLSADQRQLSERFLTRLRILSDAYKSEAKRLQKKQPAPSARISEDLNLLSPVILSKTPNYSPQKFLNL